MNAKLLNFDSASCPRPSGRQVLWVFILCFIFFCLPLNPRLGRFSYMS